MTADRHPVGAGGWSAVSACASKWTTETRPAPRWRATPVTSGSAMVWSPPSTTGTAPVRAMAWTASQPLEGRLDLARGHVHVADVADLHAEEGHLGAVHLLCAPRLRPAAPRACRAAYTAPRSRPARPFARCGRQPEMTTHRGYTTTLWVRSPYPMPDTYFGAYVATIRGPACPAAGASTAPPGPAPLAATSALALGLAAPPAQSQRAPPAACAPPSKAWTTRPLTGRRHRERATRWPRR